MSKQTTPADQIVASVCNQHRNSDLRADNPDIIAAFNERIAELERERDAAQRNALRFSDEVVRSGEDHNQLCRELASMQAERDAALQGRILREAADRFGDGQMARWAAARLREMAEGK